MKLLFDKIKSNNDSIKIEKAVFELKEKSPLSWHLTKNDKLKICSYWENANHELYKVDNIFSDKQYKDKSISCNKVIY